jgi:S-DNA-T family DNA segregation ATPase FtsK/SpoIIIE
MSRKESPEPNHGFGEIIGVALLVAALLLLAAQVSFDRCDLSFIKNPPNHPAANWIGPFGAWLAYGLFFLLGLGAYVLPALLGAFGLASLAHFPAQVRARPTWSLVWSAVLMLALDGLLHLLGAVAWVEQLRSQLNAPSAGGWVGQGLEVYGFWMLGSAGAAIVYGALCLISLLFLTNFRLTDAVARLRERRGESTPALGPEERDLERKARELEKKKQQLEEVVQQSGLGIDGQPLPEPQVRDLSVPQLSKAGLARAKKAAASEAAREIEPAAEVEVIPAREVRAAVGTADILGKPLEPIGKAAAATPVPPPAPPADPRILDRSGALLRKPLKKKPVTVAQVPIIGNYQLPPIDLLALPDTTVKPTESKEELLANARLMQQTLAQFEIEVALGDITKGPTITRYELHPSPGVRLERITALTNNITAALKAERIHILAPVPGKSSVGIEVPNLIKTKVIMRDLLESEEWRNTKARIPLCLGKDVYGHPIISDLAEMPHILIAGSTGSGKSVCINSIVASLLYRFTPEQLRFVMIDPKVVELQQYNALPHLVVPVVTDPKKVTLALRWVVSEMEKRYQIFARVGVRNIKSFNERPQGKALPAQEPELPLMAKKEKVEAGADGFAVEVDEQIVVPRDDDIVIPEKLSYIVVIIDELADLMLVAPADVEMAIARITQMARAAGIHVIVATQRPSVDVITGVIKANIPARIAFQVASRVDSRTILDAMGADKLLGKGDMLYLPPGSAKLTRAQGALITDQELQGIVDFIAKQAKPSYELDIHQQLSKPDNSHEGEEGIDEDEDLIQQCIEVIRSEQKASVSLMQRRLRLGYTRAARIMDELENRGIVGPSKGAEPRDILIDLDGQGHDGSDSAGDEDLAPR